MLTLLLTHLPSDTKQRSLQGSIVDTLERSRVLSCRWILPLWEVLYCILNTKGVFVLFHGLRKQENSVEFGPLSNRPPAPGGCPCWPPPLPPPLPEDSSLKAHNLALGHLPKALEMLIWQIASLLSHLPWFKCPKSPGRASCAGNQKIREDHRRQHLHGHVRACRWTCGSGIKYTHKQIRMLKMPFCSLLAAVNMLTGSDTASDGGRVQTSFFTHTSHLLEIVAWRSEKGFYSLIFKQLTSCLDHHVNDLCVTTIIKRGRSLLAISSFSCHTLQHLRPMASNFRQMLALKSNLHFV